MTRRLCALLVAASLFGCAKDSTVRLKVRIAGDDRKTPLRNPGTPSTPASDVDVLKLQVYNTKLGVNRESEVTNDFSISDKIKVGALNVTTGPDWLAVLTGADRLGSLYAMGRSTSFDVPKAGTVEVPILFGIADDFATNAVIKGGIGPFATANAMPNGSVLLIGLGGAMIHEPIAGSLCTSCLTGDVPPPRYMHVAITLLGGRVFIAGGASPTGALLSDCYLFDPSSRSFSKLTVAGYSGRIGAAAALLSGGKVLLAGGRGATAAEGTGVVVIDPAGGTLTQAPPLPEAVMLAAATTLSTGEVLVTGGLSATGAPVATANVYSGDGTTVKVAPPLATARGAHSSTLLADGYVFLFGGRGAAGTSLSTAEVFTPTSKFITVDSPNLEARAGHAAVRLDTDDLLIIGGQDDLAGPPDPARWVAALRFTPEREVAGKYAGTFVPIGQVVSRVGAAAVTLPDLSVIVVGGARPTLAVDPSAAPAAGDWVESLELFMPCAIKGRACPR